MGERCGERNKEEARRGGYSMAERPFHPDCKQDAHQESLSAITRASKDFSWKWTRFCDSRVPAIRLDTGVRSS
jgi:hypothetical protein